MRGARREDAVHAERMGARSTGVRVSGLCDVGPLRLLREYARRLAARKRRCAVTRDVVALYVDQRGPYPQLVADWYDETRDARGYGGTLPVVAHPPCGPWGRLRHLCRRLNERSCAPAAVAAVRAYGGVLEHPRYSLLWGHCGLPRPDELPDAWGGRTLEVSQCDWGHVARKMTWLYVVGVPSAHVPPMPTRREPTHWISGGRGRVGKKAKTTPVPPGIKVCSAQQRRRTPPQFAEWLVELASQARRAA